MHATPSNIAIFCDFENVAIGASDEGHEHFDMKLVLARFLDKGKVIVKRAYADWNRYKRFKKGMHEAGFELIEVPHVSYSGKNSADIRLVVDALDMCHTKRHIDLFVVISGDSDFSPLVQKLRENDKRVVGLGVQGATSDLLVENCDEFLFYGDIVREERREDRQVEGREPEDAIDLVMGTVESLMREDDGYLWGSVVKQTLRRKRPGFSETPYGYRNFSELLEAARDRGYLELKRDERSGGYKILSFEAPEA